MVFLIYYKVQTYNGTKNNFFLILIFFILLCCINIYLCNKTSITIVKWANTKATLTESLRNIEHIKNLDFVFINSISLSDVYSNRFDTETQQPYKEDTKSSVQNDREHLKNGYYELKHNSVYIGVNMSKTDDYIDSNYDFYKNENKSILIYSKSLIYNGNDIRIVFVESQPQATYQSIISDDCYNLTVDIFKFIKETYGSDDVLIIGNAPCHNPHSVFVSIFNDQLNRYVWPSSFLNYISYNTSLGVGNNDILIIPKKYYNRIEYSYLKPPAQSYAYNILSVRIFKSIKPFPGSRCFMDNDMSNRQKNIIKRTTNADLILVGKVGNFNPDKHTGTGFSIEKKNMSESDVGATIFMNSSSNF